MKPVVIVGSGLAGYGVARELRRRDKAVPIVLVTADGGEYYSKPALSNALAHGQSPAQLVLNTPEDMARVLKAEIVTRRRVLAIDAADRRVLFEDGGLDYASLVLAIGARGRRPPLEGDAVADILGINSLDDYAVFRARLADARRVVILGAGLVGCELANDLAIAGLDVHVVEMAPHALPRLLGPEEAAVLAHHLQEAGVRFTFGARVARVDRCEAGYRVSLAGGASLEAELVLAATGLAPNVQLASDAGLAIGKGIVVDRYLRTSDAHIYALGDCAEVCGEFLPYTEPIRHAARALGTTLAGTPTAVVYPEMPVELKTPAYPMLIGKPRAAA